MATIIINNVGNRAIAIEEIGFLKNKNNIDLSYKKYLLDEFSPFIIESGSINVIEYAFALSLKEKENDYEKTEFYIRFHEEKIIVDMLTKEKVTA